MVTFAEWLAHHWRRRREEPEPELEPYVAAGQQKVRDEGLCGHVFERGGERLMCVKPAGHPPPHGEPLPTHRVTPP